MDRRKFLKAGMLGGIASTLPVSSAQATEMVEPIPGALGNALRLYPLCRLSSMRS